MSGQLKAVDSDEDFRYRISTLPNQVKKTTTIEALTAPQSLPKLKMYFFFTLGLGILIFLAVLTLQGIKFNGLSTYSDYLQRYLNLGNSAVVSLIVMLVVNVFWILINILIDYLAVVRQWIPKRSGGYQTNSKSLTATEEIRLTEDEEQKHLRQFEMEKKDQQEDEEEFNAILKNPFLSPLAFLWKPFKTGYRKASVIPHRIALWWHKFQIWNEKAWQETLEFLGNLGELLKYFLNPLNLIEEVMDVGVIVLVRFLYPALLTPIIFFLPIKEKYTFGSIFNFFLEVIIYFLIIGALRVGVEFFSIYMRFLRNSR